MYVDSSSKQVVRTKALCYAWRMLPRQHAVYHLTLFVAHLLLVLLLPPPLLQV